MDMDMDVGPVSSVAGQERQQLRLVARRVALDDGPLWILIVGVRISQLISQLGRPTHKPRNSGSKHESRTGGRRAQ